MVGAPTELRLDLSKQVALVTGGVRGIGRAICEALGRNGASLVICDIDAGQVATAAAELAAAHGVEVLGLRCNVTSTDDVAAMMKAIDDKFGRLDIVCNNAGINVGATPEEGRLPVDQFRRSDWDKILAVDLTGAFDVAQRAIPLLRKAGGGRIVNIASVAAVHPLRLQVGFGAAKAGVVNMTQCMALVRPCGWRLRLRMHDVHGAGTSFYLTSVHCVQELGGEGILVNAIAPGSIVTEGTGRLWGKSDKAADTYDASSNKSSVYSGNTATMMAMIPQGRPGVGDDIAQGVLFLAGSNYTNGHCLVIDGGWSISIRPF